MAATIVEFDSLADAVGAAPQYDHLAPIADVGFVLGLAEQRRLIGRVKVRSRRVELRGAAIDALEHRTYAELQAGGANFRGELPFYDLFTLGGPISFPGLGLGQLRGTSYWTTQVSYMHKVADLSPLFGQTL